MLSYKTCKVNGKYEGAPDVEFCKGKGPMTMCSACSVKFPCAKGKEVPEPKCTVNVKARDQWVEYGLQRFRTVFSASAGIDVSKYCDEWSKSLYSLLKLAVT